jgi:drug/metabolite transporter (DMT)-like permease
MNSIAILSKLLAESLLSLYPTFVKNIHLPIGLQSWSRFITYLLVSSAFIDWAFVYKSFITGPGLLLSLITIVHVYTSYKGFQLLEGGVAYALFYTYPLMILLMSGEPIKYTMIFAVIGVLLLANHENSFASVPKATEFSRSPTLTLRLAPNTKTTDKNQEKEKEKEKEKERTANPSNILGYVMIFFAALTEAIIYFLVRHIKTDNSWNHVFISYLLGALTYSAVYFKDIITIEPTGNLSISLFINIFIGLFGYLLRFFSMSRLSASVYAPLSYFGIVMASIYGYMFNGEDLSPTKIIGIICIMIANIGTI